MARHRQSPQPETDLALRFYDIGLPEQKSKENVHAPLLMRFAKNGN
jgi:hypothetical protein